MVSNISHSGVMTQVRRDAMRRETARIDGRGNVTRTAYDSLGRVAATIDALTNATTFAYDAYGANTNEAVIGVAGTNTIERFTDAYGRDAGYALNGARQTILGYDERTGRLATMATFCSLDSWLLPRCRRDGGSTIYSRFCDIIVKS